MSLRSVLRCRGARGMDDPLGLKGCQDYTKHSTVAQQTQHKALANTDRSQRNGKNDCESGREENRPLLRFPSPKSLLYYW